MHHFSSRDSAVAGGGVCVVSEEGRGSGGCGPGKIFHFPPQNNGVLLDFVCKKDYKTEKPLPDERLKKIVRLVEG